MTPGGGNKDKMEKKVKRTKASSMKNRRVVPQTKSSVWLIRRVAPVSGPDFVNDPNFVNDPDFVESAGYDGDDDGVGASVDTTDGFSLTEFAIDDGSIFSQEESQLQSKLVLKKMTPSEYSEWRAKEETMWENVMASTNKCESINL